MRTPRGHRPLLCELHAHTTWSDGAYSLRELAVLYASAGFDVLCVTDRAVRSGETRPRSVGAAGFPPYLRELEQEADAPGGATASCWKTLLPCAKDEASVVEYLRSGARAYLAPFVLEAGRAAA